MVVKFLFLVGAFERIQTLPLIIQSCRNTPFCWKDRKTPVDLSLPARREDKVAGTPTLPTGRMDRQSEL